MSDWSWSIVERSGRDLETLRRIAWTLSAEQLWLLREEIRSAASYINNVQEGGETEDGLLDLTEWMVFLGRDNYNAILENPALLPLTLDDEAFSPAAVLSVVLQEKYGMR